MRFFRKAVSNLTVYAYCTHSVCKEDLGGAGSHKIRLLNEEKNPASGGNAAQTAGRDPGYAASSGC